MSSRSNAGGVFSVEMWPSSQSGESLSPSDLKDKLTTVKVAIISADSSYTESVTLNGSTVKVEHTLTITTAANDMFLLADALADGQYLGYIAQVEISSYGKITLGWSSTLGYDQPLRLVETTFQSGQAVNSTSTKRWVFKAYSTTPLI